MHLSMKDLVSERVESASEDVHFPKALVRAVLEDYSSPGDTVLDPFAGYGTTLAVCEELRRSPLGIELRPERVAAIRGRIGSAGRLIQGDARQLNDFEIGAIDLCFTSPPYMSEGDHPQNPLTGYATFDGSYATYLEELTDVFIAVKHHLRPGGYLVVNAANIRTGDTVTPLAWDIAHALKPHLAFRGETYLEWDRPPAMFSGDYCMAFQNSESSG